MSLQSHVCEKCRQPGIYPNATFMVYDGDALVGKLHRFVVEDGQGLFYGKAIASDKSWLDYEAEQMQKSVPALYPAAYEHPGRSITTSPPLPSLAAAEQAMHQQFAEVKAWLEQRTGQPIEIVE